MNSKTTRRALLGSVLAMVLCFTMLLSTTFAWFTDTVTSANNKIVAGTLKVDLEVLGDTGFVSIKNDSTPLFNYEKWEPGYTEFKILKIENEGTLALKWYATFSSTTPLSILADVIDVYVCPSATEIGVPADRNLAGYTKVGTLAEFVNTIETTTNGVLYADGTAGDEAYLGIALKMREEAGNEYQGKDLGGAFDITILATQLNFEADSFGTDYDKNAVVADSHVTNAADLATALTGNASGKTIALTAGEYTLPTLSGKSGVTLVGAEGTVVGGENVSTGFGGNFGNDTTIKNITFSGATNGVRYSYAQGGTSVFENCTFAGDSTYGFHIDESKGATFIFNNCTFSGFNAFAGDLTKVVFNNCTFLNNGNYGHTNIWSVGEFNNCTFGAGTSVGPRGSATITIDGVAITGVVEF